MTKALLIATLLATGIAGAVEARSLLDGNYRIERVVVDGRVVRPADDKVGLSIQGDRITGFSGCNRFMGALRYQDQTIAIGPLAGTRMACLDAGRSQLESDVLAALQAANRFALDAGQHAVLLRGPQGQLVTLVRQGQGVEKVLQIAPQTRSCSGVGKMECLQVRESAGQDWQLLYQGIEGFQREEGVAYVLKVREERVDNPPADAPDRRLVLIEVLERRP
ncbi:META and DUF4377 domain-containing protein [Chitinolyticbacter meiyuanensis]|uniref:META and DUF4377 domain-containing protein n=1 Tax=Chitinolyticbacter meiyuanensis TaxID=682798 RepID=UPI0011E5D7F4|nr:META and DUF4377 domain-containing protein [Chitinolyticbacter meiyuanensis]